MNRSAMAEMMAAANKKKQGFKMPVVKEVKITKEQYLQEKAEEEAKKKKKKLGLFASSSEPEQVGANGGDAGASSAILAQLQDVLMQVQRERHLFQKEKQELLQQVKQQQTQSTANTTANTTGQDNGNTQELQQDVTNLKLKLRMLEMDHKKLRTEHDLLKNAQPAAVAPPPNNNNNNSSDTLEPRIQQLETMVQQQQSTQRTIQGNMDQLTDSQLTHAKQLKAVKQQQQQQQQSSDNNSQLERRLTALEGQVAQLLASSATRGATTTTPTKSTPSSSRPTTPTPTTPTRKPASRSVSPVPTKTTTSSSRPTTPKTKKAPIVVVKNDDSSSSSDDDSDNDSSSSSSDDDTPANQKSSSSKKTIPIGSKKGLEPFEPAMLFKKQQKDEQLQNYLNAGGVGMYPKFSLSYKLVQGKKLVYFYKKIYVPAALRRACLAHYAREYGTDNFSTEICKHAIWPTLDADITNYKAG